MAHGFSGSSPWWSQEEWGSYSMDSAPPGVPYPLVESELNPLTRGKGFSHTLQRSWLMADRPPPKSKV